MIKDILEGIQALFNLFRDGTKVATEMSEKRDAALSAIYMACTETKAYAHQWDRTGKRSKETETELARLWKKASIHVRHFDKQLADKCYYKGEYWLDPDNWNDSDTRRLGVSLDRVILEARDLQVMSDAEYEKARLRPKRSAPKSAPQIKRRTKR